MTWRDHGTKLADKCSFWGQWAIMAFNAFILYMASRFDFDFVWPAVLLMLTTFGVLAGLLASYAAVVEEANERQLLRSACREAINGSLFMATGIMLMAFYYLTVVYILGYSKIPSLAPVTESPWTMVALVPLYPMYRATNCIVNAVAMYADHAWRNRNLRG